MAKDSPIDDRIYLLVTSGLIVISTLIFLFFLRGAEDPANLSLYIIYGVSIGVFTSLLGAIKTHSGKLKRYFEVRIHDPEKGIFPNVRFIRDPFRLILISLIIFNILGIFAVATNTFASRPTPGQISPLAEPFFQIEPASWAETLILLTAMMFITAGIRWVLERPFPNINKSTGGKTLTFFLGAAIAGFAFFPGLHILVYGDTETDLLATMYLGGSCSMEIFISGSMIPCWVHHSTNNFYAWANDKFSDEFTYVIAIILILSMILLYYYIFIRGKRND